MKNVNIMLAYNTIDEINDQIMAILELMAVPVGSYQSAHNTAASMLMDMQTDLMKSVEEVFSVWKETGKSND